MKRLSIEAFEDTSAPGGGHAVVLLHGLDQVPQPATFRLKIIDALALASETSGGRISDGNLEPARVRTTPDGVELLIGPEVTACPLLMPGTAVEIVVPAANAQGGFLWPAVTPAEPKTRRRSLRHKARRDDERSPGGATATHSADATDRMSWRPARPALLQRLGFGWPNGTTPRPWAYATAVALGVCAVELGIWAVGATVWLRPARDVTAAAVVAPTPRPAATDLSHLLLQSWLRAGTVSPRGVSVAGVTPTRALERAERHFGSGAERDTAEGVFWLHFYLAATAGESLHVRALTQLGSAHAAPTSGAADHALARQHWELAAAMGDATAMCLLSEMYASGRVAKADAVLAQHWRERARRVGDCPEKQP